jgi:hypothetical protein
MRLWKQHQPYQGQTESALVTKREAWKALEWSRGMAVAEQQST